MIKVRVGAKITYGPEALAIMVCKYMWGTFHSHRVMGNFLSTQFQQHPEVAPQITLHLLKHRAPRVEASEMKQKVEAQEKILTQIKNTCNGF